VKASYSRGSTSSLVKEKWFASKPRVTAETMPVITFSSSFGSGGSVVAAGVAHRLGWKVVNRLIPAEVASSLSVPLEAALAKDEASESRVGRLLARLSIQISLDAASHLPTEAFMNEGAFRRQSEAIIRRLAADSNCVIVGRASAIVLADLDPALHVRLDGHPDRRVVQVAEALKISAEESAARLVDRPRPSLLRQALLASGLGRSAPLPIGAGQQRSEFERLRRDCPRRSCRSLYWCGFGTKLRRGPIGLVHKGASPLGATTHNVRETALPISATTGPPPRRAEFCAILS